MSLFQYHPEILARFPALCGGIVVAEGVRVPSDNPATDTFYAEQAAVRARLGDTPLSEVPSLAAWRAAFRAFGTDPTKYRSACEALLRRLTKKDDIPSINPLVDIGNLVSIRYALPVAVIDQDTVQAPITVRFASGQETYYELNSATPDHPEAGEVIFTDNAGDVIARRWCWRQSASSAATPASTHLLITVEAHHTDGRAAVSAALEDLRALLEAHVGGQIHTELVAG
jgi:DNA/RNA-binding domain of Phe-tRNA-synthetase-like protein